MSTKLYKKEVAPLSMAGLFLSSVLAAAVYVFMEWLFLVSKPSFLDTLGWGARLGTLGLSILLLAGLAALPLALLAAVRSRVKSRRAAAVRAHGFALLAAFVLAATLLLMLDNFTYTVFGIGIVHSTGFTRALYLLVFVGLFTISRGIVLGWTRMWDRALAAGPRGRLALAAIGLIVLAYGYTFARAPQSVGASLGPTGQRARLPNILIVTSDGVSAEHMSAYGYMRETTPRIKALEKDFLFAENAFSNAGSTSGSITSLLTGKYPVQTRVLYPPDILRETDAYQHLPGILKSLGYGTTQISQTYYADALTLNFHDAFDRVNGQAVSSSLLWSGPGRRMPYEVNYFLYETGGRILERLGHIFFIRKMENPFHDATRPSKELQDPEKIHQLFDRLADTSQPQFVHLHLMGTHGPTFYPSVQVFSEGRSYEDQASWDLDFYQDAILEYDRYVGQIVDWLVETGQYDNTLLILGSDHGRAFGQMKRIPLMIHFPGGVYAGHLQTNVQNLDLAPTVLEYLGVEKPGWMAGKSLLHGEVAPRPVISVSVREDLVGPDEDNNWSVDTKRVSPPFYQFQVITIISCQRLYDLDLRDYQFNSKDIQGHSHPCAEAEIIPPAEALDIMIAHLQGSGYDTTSLTLAEFLP